MGEGAVSPNRSVGLRVNMGEFFFLNFFELFFLEIFSFGRVGLENGGLKLKKWEECIEN